MADFDLLPEVELSGRLRRELLPPGDGVREGSVGDLAHVAAVDRRVRGAAHGADWLVALRTGARLLVADGAVRLKVAAGLAPSARGRSSSAGLGSPVRTCRAGRSCRGDAGGMAVGDDDQRVHLETRAAWRAWLVEHHRDQDAAWLVSWRKPSGKPAMTYDESVEEALCVGWVDSVQRKLDDQRTMLRFSRRKRGSAWSRPNKERVERLTAAGQMLADGLEAVERAKADGTWSLLDDVEDGVVPDDLAAALDAAPPAREEWEAFPRSAKRGILEWIVQAKRSETRAKRIEETARMAAKGERANQWRPKT